jgi:Protein of unknown function, DUF547
MKTFLSLLFIYGLFFFTSCFNQDQNQNAETDHSDTGVLIASNDQSSDLKEMERNIVIEGGMEDGRKENDIQNTGRRQKTEDRSLNELQPINQSTKVLEEKVGREEGMKVEDEKENTEYRIQNGEVRRQKVEDGRPKKSGDGSQQETVVRDQKKEDGKENEQPNNSINQATKAQGGTEEMGGREEGVKVEKPQTTNQKPQTAKPQTTPPQFNHDKWDQLLKKYVSASGKVNYKGFKTDETALKAYLNALENNPIQNSWSKSKKMAYWINAYNAYTIKMIVDNYPVSSITKLHGGKPWDYKWVKLNGKTYTLNNVENDILRPEYKDARIHFAVNCAAQSCPPILNKAWTENNLNQMLEKQAKAFVNNPKYNKISSDEIEISQIFEWYAVDFGNIIDFLNKYSDTKINKNAKVKYKEYNWALNE